MNTILIVDDDFQLRESFKKILIEEGYTVYTTSSGETGITILKEHLPEVVLLDICLPGMNGLETFQAMRQIDSKIQVIILTAFGTTETAIKAIKLGAFDYVLKPFEVLEMLSLIKRALDVGKFIRSKVEINKVPDKTESDAIIGQHKCMHELYKSIGRVAPTDATVLIRGESGTGKELVARAIYQHSRRVNKPFLVVNCVAIPETLLESELFGYEKGAFTGAFSRRLGKVEQVNGGTMFLDEIGDMPVSLQAKILRLLQERHVERLGGRELIPVDVRIITATNRDLEESLSKGYFREDLYYRLKVVTIWIPPLRDHLSDVSMLSDYFLTRFVREMKIQNSGITAEAKNILEQYHWPGNIRELANVIQKALIFNPGGPIGPDEIRQAIYGGSIKKYKANYSPHETFRQWIRETLTSNAHDTTFDYIMNYFGGIVVSETLALTGGNRTHAAKLLNISRPTLQAKIEKYKIKIEPLIKND
ncbi:MAG: sigma-54-dependent transcriptional regulator [bacterium]